VAFRLQELIAEIFMQRSWLLLAGILSSMLLAGQSLPKSAKKPASSAMCCAMCTKSVGHAGEMGGCAQMKGMSASDITGALEAKKTELQLTSEQISQVADVLAGSTARKGGCCHKMEHSDHGTGDH
jgi:hypothetical protein